MQVIAPAQSWTQKLPCFVSFSAAVTAPVTGLLPMVLEWRLSALQTELDGKKPQPSNEQTKKMQQHPPRRHHFAHHLLNLKSSLVPRVVIFLTFSNCLSNLVVKSVQETAGLCCGTRR